MAHDTAGDPISGLKWTHKATRKIAAALQACGIQANKDTVGRLLTALGYGLRVNHKKLCPKHRKPAEQRNRDAQFEYIAQIRREFEEAGDPIISVDTKKRELIGNFKNSGACWGKEAIPVNDHDFLSYALGIAIPFGVYDVVNNSGSVFIGTSHNTAAFAVDCVQKWWYLTGRKRYTLSKKLLILADGGGSNGSRVHLWKYYLQTRLGDHYDLTVTVCHYPPGASKWNPIEHRLFSEISKNWKGQPLTSYAKVLNFLQTTATDTGLTVNAYMVDKEYPKGEKITDEQLGSLSIVRHETFPKWNYTLPSRKWQPRM